MPKAGLIIVLTVLAFGNIKAQECYQTELSKRFNYTITVQKSEDNISKISVKIRSKNKKQFQTVSISPDYLGAGAFIDCSSVKSYLTGENKNSEVIDNDFGDFIVGDFNFDGKEDFAIKRDSGGNGGPLYSYFLQNRFSVFQKDSFLTNMVGYFPSVIDAKNKKLTTFVHANVGGYNENIYRYDTATKKWTLLKRIYRKV